MSQASNDLNNDVFEVYCARSKKTVSVDADTSIAEALITAGLDIDLCCEQGICGTCIKDVKEGLPDHRDQFLTEEEKAENKQMAVCCSRAKSARLVLDI